MRLLFFLVCSHNFHSVAHEAKSNFDSQVLLLKFKSFWKRFFISDAIKNTHDSWEKVKISTLTGV